MNKKKIVVLLVTLSLSLMLLAGCSSSKEAEASVYYLNFKPEIADIWQEIADKYEAETGVEVKVLTAASGNYEQTLNSEIAKREYPTLFQINGSVGYENWSAYCSNLSDTELYSWLIDKSLAVVGEDGGVYGIPYVEEGYGIIYNNDIMDKYFALTNRDSSISSISEINSYVAIKEVAEDMTAHKSELGIEGVFGSTSFATGEDWRWQSHLANIPIYYEFRDKGISNADSIDFTYSKNYKNIFDLYINNSCTDINSLSNKTVDDSMEEFALGKVAMIQNGNWAWSTISGVEGNVVTEEGIKFLPIYTGVEGEESQGLCVGTENYFSVNAKATKEEQEAAIEFVEWLFSSDLGKDYVTNKLKFISPFDTFSADELPTDPLAKQVVEYISDDSKTSVSWNFTAFPGQTFKDNLGANLLEYTKGDLTWEEIETDTKATWDSQKEKN